MFTITFHYDIIKKSLEKRVSMIQNLSSYWIFYTVANCKNISKAAKTLYISQPAISKSIQKLEDSLNCKLFCRSSRGVILTDEGKMLYEHVREAFDSLSVGEEKLKQSLELGVGHLTIGVSTTLCKYILLPYLKEFIRQNPHINISIKCQSTNETLQLLEDNQIDIGLVGKSKRSNNIIFHPITDIEDVFVASNDYIKNLNSKGIHNKDILSSSVLMLLDKKNITRQYIEEYLDKNEITTAEYIDVSNMDLLIDFAKIGLGIACVIKRFVSEELLDGTLIEIPIECEIPKREVGFAFKENNITSKSLQTFIDFYQNYTPEGI